MFYFSLPNAVILEVSDRDSARYLNSRLTCGVKELPIGGVCRGAALTPQGRTEGVFDILRHRDANYILVCSGGESKRVIDAFKRYIVADRVCVIDISREYKLLHLAGLAGTLSSVFNGLLHNSPAPGKFLECGDYTVFAKDRGLEHGHDILCRNESFAALELNLNKNSFALLDWNAQTLARIHASLPDFPSEVNEDSILIECGMEALISRNKGCYVGQEVIERISAIGRAPRKLIRFAFPGEPHFSEKQDVFQRSAGKDSKIGYIVSFAFDNKKRCTYVFAMVRSDFQIDSGPVIAGNIIGSLT